MIAFVRRFRRHVRSSRDLRLLLSLAVFILILPRLMRAPLPRALARVDEISRKWLPRNADPERVIRYVGALGRLHWWAFQDNCVVRSLCYYAFLKHGQEPVELRMGVERRQSSTGGEVPGRRHFWVMRGGEPLNEEVDLNTYTLLMRYPEPAP